MRSVRGMGVNEGMTRVKKRGESENIKVRAAITPERLVRRRTRRVAIGRWLFRLVSHAHGVGEEIGARPRK